MIKWLNIIEFANALGISRNTFKKYYLNAIPPQRKTGNRMYWTSDTVEKTIKQVQSGELIINTQSTHNINNI
ncbi:hypothetical protein MOMA_08511 [Moraxella macacae 0408225]|uniref:HTH merR-type domain-containing protein n=1 Tax=Moraxella macacae 0408225 TaxID=1230338 RepID=L2F6T1_9GAMM|nr:hypothetical protein MOMA_08511 [Moraxella macacae 0408225]